MTENRAYRVASTGVAKRFNSEPARPSSNTAYEKYKASLHAVFDGKIPLPEHLRQRLEPEHVEQPRVEEAIAKAAAAPERKNRRLVGTSPDNGVYLEAIRRATTPTEINHSINCLMEAGFSLPKDEELLSKALGHDSEEVVLSALKGLEGMLSEKPSKSPRLMRTRLENAAILASSSEIKELCERIKNSIAMF